MKSHRHVDWSYLPADKLPKSRVPNEPVSPEFASWLATLDELVKSGAPDAILKRAVEIARERIGLERASIFLRDEPNRLMRGSWGTDATGSVVDEHFITFDLALDDLEVFTAAARRGAYWVVVDDAPLVTHSQKESRVIGSGWVCCTPIRVASELFGVMYNDAGLCGTEIDPAQQEQTALLCSLVGAALEHARRRGFSWLDGPTRATSPALTKALGLLENDPSMTAEKLGENLRLSASRVARLFKSELGLSLVEYRNGLRLERFTRLLDERGGNLLEAALAAGFGSYAQFYRVFVAQRGTTPAGYLRSRASRQK